MAAFGTTLLVSGTESFLAMRVVADREAEALAEHPDAEIHRIDASELQDSMLAEVVGGSLFASHIIAVITDVGGTPPEVVDQLVAVAKDPGAELCLILVHHGGNKGKGLMDKLKKAKIPVATVAALKAWELPKFCQAEAKRQGIGLSQEAAGALVEAVGTDLRALSAALAQLADDAGGDRVDRVLIQRYFAGRADVTSFAVADAVLAGQGALALEKLRWALDTGVAAVLITSAMAGAFRGFGKYLDAGNQRMNEYELARQLGVPAWKLKQYAKVAGGWQVGGVAAAIGLIAEADADVKGAAGDADYALERMVLAVLAQRRQARPRR